MWVAGYKTHAFAAFGENPTVCYQMWTMSALLSAFDIMSDHSRARVCVIVSYHTWSDVTCYSVAFWFFWVQLSFQIFLLLSPLSLRPLCI